MTRLEDSSMMFTGEHARNMSKDAIARKPLDAFDVPRCPICRRDLVAQMTATGPGFPCDCQPK